MKVETIRVRVKTALRSLGVSLSELIRRSLEKDIDKNPAADASAFFDQLPILESFAASEPETYVRTLRANSRLLRDPADES